MFFVFVVGHGVFGFWIWRRGQQHSTHSESESEEGAGGAHGGASHESRAIGVVSGHRLQLEASVSLGYRPMSVTALNLSLSPLAPSKFTKFSSFVVCGWLRVCSSFGRSIRVCEE